MLYLLVLAFGFMAGVIAGRLKPRFNQKQAELYRESFDAQRAYHQREINAMNALVESLADRVHKQSELLSKKAEAQTP